MRKRTSVHRKRRLYKHRSFDFSRLKMILREEWKMVTLISIFLSGMIIGAIAAKHTDNAINAKLITMFSDFTMLRSTQSIFQTFVNSFIVSFIYLSIVFAFGLCAVGIPIISIIPLCRGIGIGMIAGYLYSTYSLSGAGYCMVILFPSAIISTAALLFGCNESFVMSYEIFNVMSGKIPNQYGNIFKRYSLRYFILLAIITVSAVIDTVMTVIFAGNFSF